MEIKTIGIISAVVVAAAVIVFLMLPSDSSIAEISQTETQQNQQTTIIDNSPNKTMVQNSNEPEPAKKGRTFSAEISDGIKLTDR